LLKVHVTYIDSSGIARTLEAISGISVMEAAKQNGIPEIDADCGGVCACATCHAYVEQAWLDRFSPMSRIENSLLSLLQERQPNSRLSCQLKLTEEHNGLTIRTARSIIPA
jgi:2Fe-2S ferredoxin